MVDRGGEFLAYAQARGRALRRTAYQLCGDWHAAEDLVQTALTKLYVAWPRVQPRRGRVVRAHGAAADVPGPARARRSSSEVVLAEVPETAAPEVPVEERLELMRALASLPVAQRAVLVLR